MHGLRQSHCTHLFVAGVDVKTVSERMGHGSASFTLDHYSQVLPGSQAGAADAVAALWADSAGIATKLLPPLTRISTGREHKKS